MGCGCPECHRREAGQPAAAHDVCTASWRPERHPARRLADFQPLTDYDKELVFGTFSAADACNFGVHIYPGQGDALVVSIVVDAGSHGTHVAGITAAHHEDSPAMNGIAPGAHPD